jgi:hypothetical protein
VILLHTNTHDCFATDAHAVGYEGRGLGEPCSQAFQGMFMIMHVIPLLDLHLHLTRSMLKQGGLLFELVLTPF